MGFDPLLFSEANPAEIHHSLTELIYEALEELSARETYKQALREYKEKNLNKSETKALIKGVFRDGMKESLEVLERLNPSLTADTVH